ncbi:MAG: hypothetical protein J3Q66DRAFT_113191 [Benniella sp.]|nr:MAG: hypothetical protein J3Q66DRAFT_113191 [Benniella sp.]
MKLTSYLTALASILALGAVARASGDLGSCGSADDAMVLESWDNTPIHVDGTNFCITLTGTVKEELKTGIKSQLLITFTNNIPVLNEETEVCQDPCPMGLQTFKVCTEIGELIAGFDLNIYFFGGGEHDQAFCLAGRVTPLEGKRFKTGLRVQG